MGVSDLLIRYPDRVPVYVKTVGTYLDKCKYLVPRDMTVGQFTLHIRKRLKINSYESVFLFVDNNTLPSNSVIFDHLYSQHADNDQLLYLTYGKEHTFG